MTWKIIYLARRAPGVSREDWPRTWRSHAIFASQFPALDAKIDWMRYTNRVEVELPGLSQAHDGVCVAAGPSLEGLNGSGFSAEDRALIDADELRVFDRLTPNFTWYCTEEVVRDGPLGEVALFRFLPPDAAPSPDAPPARAKRHVINRAVNEASLFPLTTIAESWFDDRRDALLALEEIPPGPGGNLTILTEVCHRWPK